MVKRIILSAIVCVVLSISMALAAGRHIDQWNDNAAHYNFGTYPGSASATFADMYFGDDIEADLAGIWGVMTIPPEKGTPDDTFNATLENL